MLKWVLIVVGALVGIVAIVTVVGALLPTAHVARASVTLSQPPDSVWRVVRDLGSYPDWWSNVESAERLPDRDGRETWLHRDRHDQALPLEIIRDEPPHRLVTRIAHEDLPFGGTWTYELEEGPTGSRIAVTENGEVYNPIFRFMARFVFGHHATLESYLQALGARFGEDVTPRRGPAG